MRFLYPKLDGRLQILASVRRRSGSSSSFGLGSGLGGSWGPTYKTSSAELGKSTCWRYPSVIHKSYSNWHMAAILWIPKTKQPIPLKKNKTKQKQKTTLDKVWSASHMKDILFFNLAHKGFTVSCCCIDCSNWPPTPCKNIFFSKFHLIEEANRKLICKINYIIHPHLTRLHEIIVS